MEEFYARNFKAHFAKAKIIELTFIYVPKPLQN